MQYKKYLVSSPTYFQFTFLISLAKKNLTTSLNSHNLQNRIRSNTTLEIAITREPLSPIFFTRSMNLCTIFVMLISKIGNYIDTLIFALNLPLFLYFMYGFRTKATKSLIFYRKKNLGGQSHHSRAQRPKMDLSSYQARPYV